MLKITIPAPCHQDWNNMQSRESGRHCAACSKTVIDFTAMSDAEISNFFAVKQDENICGRFKDEQVQRGSIDLPSNIFHIEMPWWKCFLAASLIIFGTTLFSCNSSTKGEIIAKEYVIRDSSLPVNIPYPDFAIKGTSFVWDTVSTTQVTECRTIGVVLNFIDTADSVLKDFPVITNPIDSAKIHRDTDTIIGDTIMQASPSIPTENSIQADNPVKKDSTGCKDILPIPYS